ncbi:type III secretion system inner rod subunit SctI [Achromobacter xylosoxidans]
MSYSIQSLDGLLSSSLGGASTVSPGASLDERMAGELAQLSGAAAARQDSLLDALRTAVSDPQKLLGVQHEVAKFQLEMSVAASLARKAVGAIETLVKS